MGVLDVLWTVGVLDVHVLFEEQRYVKIKSDPVDTLLTSKVHRFLPSIFSRLVNLHAVNLILYFCKSELN